MNRGFILLKIIAIIAIAFLAFIISNIVEETQEEAEKHISVPGSI